MDNEYSANTKIACLDCPRHIGIEGGRHKSYGYNLSSGFSVRIGKVFESRDFKMKSGIGVEIRGGFYMKIRPILDNWERATIFIG